MSKKSPISYFKKQAKEQLLGNYSIAIGSFVVIFALSYVIFTVVTGAVTAFAIGDNIAGDDMSSVLSLLSNKRNSLMFTLLTYIEMAVLTPLCAIFTTGFAYVCVKITKNQRPVISDVFFVTKNHPDKIIIITLVMYGVSVVCDIPALVFEYTCDLSGADDLLIYMLLGLAGAIAGLVINIMLSLSCFVYIDDPQMDATDCMKRSIKLMKGNKWRYFYMVLSFAGYLLLIILSLGIALLWIAPYYEMTTVNFYMDAVKQCEDENEY